MKRALCSLLGGSLLVAGLAFPAVAETAFDVEHARANARAGGPISAQDKFLLDRYGALSGTPGWSPGGTYPLYGCRGSNSRQCWKKRRGYRRH